MLALSPMLITQAICCFLCICTNAITCAKYSRQMHADLTAQKQCRRTACRIMLNPSHSTSGKNSEVMYTAA